LDFDNVDFVQHGLSESDGHNKNNEIDLGLPLYIPFHTNHINTYRKENINDQQLDHHTKENK